MITTQLTAESLTAMLRLKISKALSVPQESLDMDHSFNSYGMDSMSAVMLVGELEEQLEAELPTTLFWDYPTLKELSEYLNKNVLQTI
jgi:acyl carrier protein